MTVIAIFLMILLCLCLVLIFTLSKNDNIAVTLCGKPNTSNEQSKVILDRIITLNMFPDLGDVIKWTVEKKIKRDYEGLL